MPPTVLDLPVLEHARLAALHEYALLDSPADDELSAVVRVAAMVADVPTATLNLIDENRQCQLTTVGFAGADSPRSESMCDVQLHKGCLVHLPDARQHPLYANNPWVDGRMAGVRFYASAPLITPTGYALGTLCVFDSEVKVLTERQIHRLEDLADVIVGLFERRRQARLNAELAVETERSRKFIETLLDTVEVGIAAADADGKLTVLNRTMRRWVGAGGDTGTAPHALPIRVGLLEPDGVTPMPVADAPLWRAMREDLVSNAELILETPDDGAIAVTANARSMRAGNGERIGAVVAMTDVTADRHHRRQLELAHADLAERESQLTAAVAELRRSNDELEGFAAAVSHDLVRPLASAAGYLEMLGQVYAGQFDDRATKWVHGAGQALDRMQQLVRALLDYAQAGHAPCRMAQVDLTEIVAQVATDLRAVAESNDAVIVTRGVLPTITGDATLLRQLLQNLTDNAIKYRHPDRAPRVEITCAPAPDGWTVSVTDNGAGIPAEHRDRVFDMFAQVDPASRKGHGVGLATCARIIERHAGAIAIDEAPGGGTVFHLTLPR